MKADTEKQAARPADYYNEEKRFRYLVPLCIVTILLIMDFLIFIGPGERQWPIFWMMVGGPITVLTYPLGGAGGVITCIIVTLLSLLGIFSYPIWPRKWTMYVTFVSLLFWFMSGQIFAFIDV